jgi:cell division protease FtsH
MSSYMSWVSYLLSLTILYSSSYNGVWGFLPKGSSHLPRRITSEHYVQPERDHLDRDNMKKLEKMFYLQNRKYSPYNKQNYLRRKNSQDDSHEVSEDDLHDDSQQWSIGDITNHSDRRTEAISKRAIEELAKEFQEAFDEMEQEEAEMDEQFKKLIDDVADGRIPEGAKGYVDEQGIYRHKNPSLFLFPNRGGGDSTHTDSDDDGFGSSSSANFQVVKKSPYTFADFGGGENIKEELMQVADMLKNFSKYEKYNVKVPKGLILESEPGNGKTHLVKCFAGEIKVNFIPVSGGEFSQIYVGSGSARIRELFKLADENKPCLIFIDEIDALCRKRSPELATSNSEKDQTLNQLLVNLDGFKELSGVFIIGATNRVDMLDPAVLRPGRMDKHIHLSNPDSKTRQQILEIHKKGKPMDADITMEQLVEMTAGFSGAQIHNLLNEAMLRALRQDRESITQADLEFIANRLLSGYQAKESQFTEDMIDKIIFHELGHALVGIHCKDHPKLIKVCLNRWSHKTPGFTLFDVKDEDSNIYTKAGLFSHLMVLLGGRIAEEVFFGHSTTGARKDFEEAYQLAYNMVVQYGMGQQNIYPSSSDASKHVIDQEVNTLILKAQEDTLKIITENKDLIYKCKELLKKSNVLKAEQIYELMDKVV